MARSALLIEGFIIAAIVILDGIYVAVFPPYWDEAQGYGIILIGVFIIIATIQLNRIAEQQDNS